MFIADLINKCPDILTPQERSKLDRLKDLVLIGASSALITIPYSVYLGMKARRHPTERKNYLRKMIFVPLIPLALVAIAGTAAESCF